MTLIRSVSGIRGISGKDLTPEHIIHFAGMFGSLLNKGNVISGRDTRLTGNIFEQLFANTLGYMGINTMSCGIVPTPTVLFLVSKHRSAGGFIITASHNPPEYNGIKLVSGQGKFLNSKEYTIFNSFENMEPVLSKSMGNFSEDKNLYREHIDAVLSHDFINASIIKTRKPRIVFDGGNGGGSIVIPEMLTALGAELITINTRTDSTFTRALEPIPAHLSELERTVRHHNADLGLATDGDGDRIAIVTPRRGCISEEYTIALTADYVAGKYSGDSVVINQSSSAMLEILGKRNDYSVFRAPVGEANVVDSIIAHNAIIGGEGNGGVILPSVNKTRDALIASSLILMLISESSSDIDTIIDKFPSLYMRKEKYDLDNADILQKVKKLYSDYEYTDSDGLRFNMGTGFMHIRKSGTEPILRVIGEFDSQDRLEKEFSILKRIIECAE